MRIDIMTLFPDSLGDVLSESILGLGYNLVAGANIAGFKKVATAMMEQGVF